MKFGQARYLSIMKVASLRHLKEKKLLVKDSFVSCSLTQKLSLISDFLNKAMLQSSETNELITRNMSVLAFLNCQQDAPERPQHSQLDTAQEIDVQTPKSRLYGEQIALRIEDFSADYDNLDHHQRNIVAHDFASHNPSIETCFVVPNSPTLILIAVASDDSLLGKTRTYYRGSYPSIIQISGDSYSSFAQTIRSSVLTNSSSPPPAKKSRTDEPQQIHAKSNKPRRFIAHLFGVPVGIPDEPVLQWLLPVVPQSILVLPGNVGSSKRPSSLTEVFVLLHNKADYEAVLARDHDYLDQNFIQIRPSNEKEYGRMSIQTEKALAANPNRTNTPPVRPQPRDPRRPNQPPVQHNPHNSVIGNNQLNNAPPGGNQFIQNAPPQELHRPPIVFFKLRGIPFKFFAPEVHQWLQSFRINLPPDSIVVPLNPCGKHSGLAFIAIPADGVTFLLALHNKKMGHRFVEVMVSTREEFERRCSNGRPLPYAQSQSTPQMHSQSMPPPQQMHPQQMQHPVQPYHHTHTPSNWPPLKTPV
ncbi:hypothetical protein GEMRC1_003009 [Eukaryota sp. GEM-RC1]